MRNDKRHLQEAGQFSQNVREIHCKNLRATLEKGKVEGIVDQVAVKRCAGVGDSCRVEDFPNVRK